MKYSYKEQPKEIIEELLKYHDIKSLRKILNAKSRKKIPKANNYLDVSIDVYLLQYQKDSTQIWAIEQIAEKRNISEKTIHNHITKFKKRVKEDLEKSKYKEEDKMIKSLIAHIYYQKKEEENYEDSRPTTYEEYYDTWLFNNRNYTLNTSLTETIPDIDFTEDTIPF